MRIRMKIFIIYLLIVFPFKSIVSKIVKSSTETIETLTVGLIYQRIGGKRLGNYLIAKSSSRRFDPL